MVWPIRPSANAVPVLLTLMLPAMDSSVTISPRLTAVGASSSTKITDYYWTHYDNLSGGFGTDWRIGRAGANAVSGSLSGACTLDTDSSVAYDTSSVGARLTY